MISSNPCDGRDSFAYFYMKNDKTKGVSTCDGGTRALSGALEEARFTVLGQYGVADVGLLWWRGDEEKNGHG